MLAMADTPVEQFLPAFASAGVPVAFLVPTPTGYEKSIMDATYPVRDLFLKHENVILIRQTETVGSTVFFALLFYLFGGVFSD